MVQNMTLARKPFGCGIMNQISLGTCLTLFYLVMAIHSKLAHVSQCVKREKSTDSSPYSKENHVKAANIYLIIINELLILVIYHNFRARTGVAFSCLCYKFHPVPFLQLSVCKNLWLSLWKYYLITNATDRIIVLC